MDHNRHSSFRREIMLKFLCRALFLPFHSLLSITPIVSLLCMLFPALVSVCSAYPESRLLTRVVGLNMADWLKETALRDFMYCKAEFQLV